MSDTTVPQPKLLSYLGPIPAVILELCRNRCAAAPTVVLSGPYTSSYP